jgi:two-component sensor histidine kinase
MEMEAAIKERLAALARAQQLTRRGLIQQETEFSNHPTLKGLIHAIFAPYVAAGSDCPERIVVSGCDQEIKDSAVTSVALLLHELATNAAKYGALSASAGVVHIDCSSKEDSLVMTWEERGGLLSRALQIGKDLAGPSHERSSQLSSGAVFLTNGTLVA